MPSTFKRLLFVLVLTLPFGLRAQDFRVQAGAFAKPVDESYFTDRGVESVVSSVDQNGIYRYFVGTYWTREEAEVVKNQLITKGFAYATIIDLEEQRALYGAKCPYFKDQDIFIQKDSVRNIFFETGKSDVDAGSRLIPRRSGPDVVANPRRYHQSCTATPTMSATPKPTSPWPLPAPALPATTSSPKGAGRPDVHPGVRRSGSGHGTPRL